MPALIKELADIAAGCLVPGKDGINMNGTKG